MFLASYHVLYSLDEVELAAFSVCCFPFGRKWSQSVARIIVILVVLMLDISTSALAAKAAVPRLAVVVGVLQQVLCGIYVTYYLIIYCTNIAVYAS